MDVTLPQPPPVPNDGPCVQDLVIKDLGQLTSLDKFAWDTSTFSRGAVDYVRGDITRRKAQGIKKYGMVLQPHNGRDALVDAYQEALDLTQYLRQLKEEGVVWIDISYMNALYLTCHLRQLIMDLGR